MPLILWDVDLTLVRCGPIGREVFDTAVADALGSLPGDHGVQMAGKTDPQIAREILEYAGVRGEACTRQLPGVLAGLERSLAAAADRLAHDGSVLPGAEDVLRRLAAEPSVVQTVLTGNIRPNARVKLAAFGLDRFIDFDCGAYGSDSPVRTDLVPIARRRAEQRHGRAFPAEETWVVGDTPLDLACARAGATRCLLVASGHHGYDELLAAAAGSRADAVVADLTDTDAVIGVLLGTGPAPAT